MTRLNLVLLLAVLVSALYLVRTQYESRRLFVALEKAASQARNLEQEHERLEVDKRAQATPLRVERLAREFLHMHAASPALTQYVSYREPTSASLGTSGSSSTAVSRGVSP